MGARELAAGLDVTVRRARQILQGDPLSDAQLERLAALIGRDDAAEIRAGQRPRRGPGRAPSQEGEARKLRSALRIALAHGDAAACEAIGRLSARLRTTTTDHRQIDWIRSAST